MTAHRDLAQRHCRSGAELRGHGLGLLLAGALALNTTACLKLKSPKAAGGGGNTEYMKMETDWSRSEVPVRKKPSAYFVVDGKPYCFMGTNNYYLTYKPKEMVLDVLDHTQAMGLKVMRVWGYLDMGSLDGSVKSVDGNGKKDGVYFQYWDPEKGEPVINEGADGMERLDYVLTESRKRGIKVIVALTNNWHDFGGMDQYLEWYGLKRHTDFYTDGRVKAAFKGFINYLLHRENSIDGTVYKDDPAVFAWELANEPRCRNFSDYDDPSTCGKPEIITSWADEMSAYVKSLDPRHMVAVGDEGFFNRPHTHWAYDGSEGADHEALINLKHIDFGTFHLYPDDWGAGHRWGNQWIDDHVAAAHKVNKPTLLEEFGTKVRRDHDTDKIIWGWKRRKLSYINWNEHMINRGGQASLFWMLAGIEKGDSVYPDYDHFTVYHPDRTSKLLASYVKKYENGPACANAAGLDHGPPSPIASWRPAPRPGVAVAASEAP